MHDSFLFWKPSTRTGSRRLHRIAYSCRKVMAPIWLVLIAPIRCLSSFMNRYYITWARPRGDLLQFLFIFTFFYKAHLLINDCEKGIKGALGAFVFRDGNAIFLHNVTLSKHFMVRPVAYCFNGLLTRAKSMCRCFQSSRFTSKAIRLYFRSTQRQLFSWCTSRRENVTCDAMEVGKS